MLSGALCQDGGIANLNGDISMSFTPENFTVWAEIPVANIDRAIAFYNTVFSTD